MHKCKERLPETGCDDLDTNPSVTWIIDPVSAVEFRDDFWLRLARIGDTLGVTSTTKEHQVAGIINLELAEIDLRRARFRTVKLTGEINILRAVAINNSSFPWINDKFGTLIQWDLERNPMKKWFVKPSIGNLPVDRHLGYADLQWVPRGDLAEWWR